MANADIRAVSNNEGIPAQSTLITASSVVGSVWTIVVADASTWGTTVDFITYEILDGVIVPNTRNVFLGTRSGNTITAALFSNDGRAPITGDTAEVVPTHKWAWDLAEVLNGLIGPTGNLLDFEGVGEIEFSTAAVQPIVPEGKTVIWFSPTQ